MSKLNAKQKRFVDEYLLDLNAKQAAIRAGYSEKTAKSQGQRLLTHVDVAAAIAEKQEARSKRTEIDADWVLTQAANAFTADLSQLFNENNDLLPVDQWPKEMMPLINGIEVEALFQGRGADREQIGFTKKIKLSERLKLLDTIGKHINVQAFKERVAHEGSDGKPLPVQIIVEPVRSNQSPE